MGGNATKAVAKKAVRPLKNVFVEERAMKVIEKHKTNPTVAPRHPSTKKIIQKHVEENPHIEEEIKKEDASLIDRVNRLNLEVSDEIPKFVSKERKLPKSTARVDDPMKAFEDPIRVAKGQITYTMLLNMLEKYKDVSTTTGATAFEAEVVAKEHNLNVQDVTNILRYFKKVDLIASRKAAEEDLEEKDKEVIHAYETDDETDILNEKLNESDGSSSDKKSKLKKYFKNFYG